MATEADKTHTGVIATAFAIGTAAMIGGSAAIVALARTELDDVGRNNQVYADLETVGNLKAAQRQQLQTAKVPIEQAKRDILAAVKQDPRAASPAGATAAVAPEGEAGGAGPADEEAGEAGEQPAGAQEEQTAAPAERDKSAQEADAQDKPLEVPGGDANTAGKGVPSGSAAPAEGGQQ